MAKKDINLGTQPTGAGGDTNRSANVKINANFTELYKAMGAVLNKVNSGAEGAILPTALPIANGGTGGTTAEEARANLGIETANMMLSGQVVLASVLDNYLDVSGIKIASTGLTNSNILVIDFPHVNLGHLVIELEIIRATNGSVSPTVTVIQIPIYNSLASAGHSKGIITNGSSEVVEIKRGILDTRRIFTVKFANGIQGRPSAKLRVYGASANGKFTDAQMSNFFKMKFIEEASAEFAQYAAVATTLVKTNTVALMNDNGVIPITSGGTGADTVAEARANLGLSLAESVTDLTPGRVLRVGDFGVGKQARLIGTGVTDVIGSGFGYSGLLFDVSAHAYVASVGTRGFLIGSLQKRLAFRSIEAGNVYGDIVEVRTFANTTVDSNGFIKAASPIIELYADYINRNSEAKEQSIAFEKLGVGDYLIKGSSGFAESGWFIEQPKDANGNVYHAVVYEQLENGDLSIKTYALKSDSVKVEADLSKPVDIKEGRFIAIRLNELPQPEETQPDPTIVDSEGNPAPSRLHELQNGVWVISEENAAVLEQERLERMPDLTRRQFRMVLVLNGYDLANIETLINSIEDPMQRQITMIEWQDATTFHRTNPSLITMAGLMGLDVETVDQLWTQALTL